MNYLLAILSYILLAFIYISTIIIVYANFRSAYKDSFLNRRLYEDFIIKLGLKIGWPVYFGYFFGLVFFLSGGFEKAFFFIPSDWGSFDQLEYVWRNTKEGLSFTFGFTFAALITEKTGDILKKIKQQADNKN